MANNNNMSLDEMMPSGKKPRTGGVSIDLTQGKPKTIATNDPDEQVIPEVKSVGKAKATPKKAVAVQSGPVDFSQMQPIDVHDVLPKRDPEPNPVEVGLWSDLDAAIEREKKSIDERIDAVLDKQDEERAEIEAQKEAERQAEEDKFAVRQNDEDPTEEKDGLGLYDDDDPSPATTVTTADSHEMNRKFNFTPIDEAEVEEQSDEDVSLPDKDDDWWKTEVNVPEDSIIYQDESKEAEEDIAAEEVFTTSIDSKTEEIKIEPEEVDETAHAEDPIIGVRREVSITPNIPNDALFDDDDSSEDEDDAKVEEMINDLKSQIKERIQPIKNKLDLSKFTIAKKSVSLQKVMKLAVQDQQHVADWVMYSAKRPVSFIGLSGPEILKLNPENSTRNRVNTFREMYRIIFDHIEDANKPTFETWLKQTHFSDLNHIYFGLYMATFGGSNFVNYSCPKCNKVFIKDIDFKDMVDYASDEVKEKVRNILTGDTTSPSDDSYQVDMVQISDKYVFGLTTPSIWSVIIETGSLSDQFLEKHADLIDMVSYIDSIYLIDEANSTLIPVDTKPDPNDQAKTTARRIKAFYDIIRTLDTDEFYNLRATIQSYDKGSDDISYKIPGCTCPDCAAEIPANTDIGPDSMLFTRHQLVAIGNM